MNTMMNFPWWNYISSFFYFIVICWICLSVFVLPFPIHTARDISYHKIDSDEITYSMWNVKMRSWLFNRNLIQNKDVYNRLISNFKHYKPTNSIPNSLHYSWPIFYQLSRESWIKYRFFACMSINNTKWFRIKQNRPNLLLSVKSGRQ